MRFYFSSNKLDDFKDWTLISSPRTRFCFRYYMKSLCKDKLYKWHQCVKLYVMPWWPTLFEVMLDNGTNFVWTMPHIYCSLINRLDQKALNFKVWKFAIWHNTMIETSWPKHCVNKVTTESHHSNHDFRSLQLTIVLHCANSRNIEDGQLIFINPGSQPFKIYSYSCSYKPDCHSL